MKMRQVGNSGLTVSPLCLGGNVFGWTADEATSIQLLNEFADAGLNFIDTADIYSSWVPGHKGGESEIIIGKWLKQRGNRAKAVIATKVGMEMSADKKGLSRAYILRAVEDSLKRLQTDYIDLYQSHKDDPNTPLEETLGAYADLIKQGKVRVIGASNYTSDRLAKAVDISSRHSIPRYECLQPHYNLYDRKDFESGLEPLCVKEKIGVIPYYALASGFLTGKYRSEADLGKSARGKGVQKYLDDRGHKILKALDEVAKETRSSPAKISLAWLMARPSVTAPIASATNSEQLKDLIDSTQLKLDSASIERLNHASA